MTQASALLSLLLLSFLPGTTLILWWPPYKHAILVKVFLSPDSVRGLGHGFSARVAPQWTYDPVVLISVCMKLHGP